MEDEVRIELKYCERCGGLFLRNVGNENVYCAACAPEMREMAAPRRTPARPHAWNGVAAQLGGVACA